MNYNKYYEKLCTSIDPTNSETTIPNCNEVYREGCEAYKSGVRRESNPYLSKFMQEITYTWNSEDCWNLGWDLEKNLADMRFNKEHDEHTSRR